MEEVCHSYRCTAYIGNNHQNKVLVHLDKTDTKRQYTSEVTKEAGPEVIGASGCSVGDEIKAQNDEMKRHILVMKALELSQTKGPIITRHSQMLYVLWMASYQ